MSVRVYVIADRAKRYFKVDAPLLKDQAVSNAAERFADYAERLDRSTAVPRKTGNLQESFWIRKEEAGRVMRMGWDAQYSRAVDEGLPPSPGRYVPAIDKRLVKESKRNPNIGMWPGFAGRNFVEPFLRDCAFFYHLFMSTEIFKTFVKGGRGY